MPWQRLVADVLGELDPDTGQLWYTEGNVAVGRQCGKTQLGMGLKTHRATRFGGRQVITYFAQTRDKAREKFVEEHLRILKESPAFAGHFTPRLSNGSEHVAWHNGSRWGIDAPTRKAGHGSTVDYADIDEAFAHADNSIELGIGPAMITRPSKQLIVWSAAGDARSFYWWGKVKAGRKACTTEQHGRTAYFEWGAPDELDPADPATWRIAIPALGYTITEAAIEAEWLKACRSDDAEQAINLFRRSYLNQWPEVPVLSTDPTGWQKITEAAWVGCKDPASSLPGGARVAFGIDMTPDRQWATICAAGVRGDGLEHLEVVDHRAGSSWVPDRVAELVERWPTVAVAVDRGGPAGSLIDDLRRVLPADMLVEPTARDHAQAAGSLFDALGAGTVRHRGQPVLDAAAQAARERPLGDAWAWTRAGTIVPISPLVAVTLARWAYRRGAAVPVFDPVQIW